MIKTIFEIIGMIFLLGISVYIGLFITLIITSILASWEDEKNQKDGINLQ